MKIEINLGLYSFIKAGKKRRIPMIKVMDKPLIPSEIAKKAKQYNQTFNINGTSDILRLFRKNGVAVCLTPEKKVGRLYALTADGEKVMEQILEE